MHLIAKLFLLLTVLCCALTFAVTITTAQAHAQTSNNNTASSSADTCDPNTETCTQDLGAVPLSPGGVVSTIMKYSVGLGGGLATILITYGGFKMVTSSGNPVEVKKAREIITYAIIGLLLILFSVTIMGAITSGILPIPDIGS